MSWNTLYILDGISLAIFVLSYYRNCYRKGYRIDIWHSQLFVFVVLPYMLMLPFAKNELNAVIVGKDFAGIVASVPTVFVIAMLGYFSTLIGGALWSLRLSIGIRREAALLLETGPRCSRMLMSSRFGMTALALLCFLAQMSLLAFYFAKSGFGFNIRAYAFENPGIRPVAQIITLSSIVMAAHCCARYIEKREKTLLGCTLLLTFGLLFSGSRSSLVYTYMNVVVCYIIMRRRSISLFRILVGTAALLGIILYLGNVREGQYSVGEFLASLIFLTFYGNSFCDLRDFAWIYNAWNHEYWLGKTYLAGFATFIPRSLSEFRTTWSFGIATDWTVGLDTELHPGLKPGQFGEAFFNFGWAGVVLFGLIIGILVRRVDLDVKQALFSSRPSMIRAFASTMLLNVALCFVTSLNLPSMYALGGMYLLAWFFLRLRVLLGPMPVALPGSG